jgi:DNA (cytosine-5)-methyltransferase 1
MRLDDFAIQSLEKLSDESIVHVTAQAEKVGGGAAPIDLPPPTTRPKIEGHWQHPGARAYDNHTGSCLDEPAKALKAGDHGVPGGENMLADRRGNVRYFTVREMARLQGFPDQFVVSGSWRAATRQLGNAVPISVGKHMGKAVLKIIKNKRRHH